LCDFSGRKSEETEKDIQEIKKRKKAEMLE